MTNIVALATPKGKGAIHIVRMTGPKVFSIINKVTLDKVNKTVDRIQITHILSSNKKIIDKVVLCKFYAPNSYTGEDLIEINTHGNELIAKMIITELINFGALPATSGEFTKRALLNKKISINDVENIQNLFASKSAAEIFEANSLVNSQNSLVINQAQEELFKLIAELEINIDYPPEIEIDHKKLKEKIKSQILTIKKKLTILYENSSIKKPSNYRILLLGKPNVGKSSLLNYLIKEEKVIVSDIQGTTRDVIEIDYFYKDYLLTLVDSAGIRNTKDLLENKSIEKTKNETNIEILDLLNNKNFFMIYTKKDLHSNLNKQMSISVKNQDLNDFFKLLDEKLSQNYLITGIKSEYIISNLYSSLQELNLCLIKDIEIDLIAEHLIQARTFLLNSIHMNENNFDRINKIFDNFCIGK